MLDELDGVGLRCSELEEIEGQCWLIVERKDEVVGVGSLYLYNVLTPCPFSWKHLLFGREISPVCHRPGIGLDHNRSVHLASPRSDDIGPIRHVDKQLHSLANQCEPPSGGPFVERSSRLRFHARCRSL